MRLAVTGDGAERNARIGQAASSRSIRADVSAERGDEETVLASADGNNASRSICPRSPGSAMVWSRVLAPGSRPYRRSVNHDFPIVDRHGEPLRVDRPCQATFLWTVDCNDRTAFRKAVTFVDRNSQAPGGIGNVVGDRRASHRDESKEDGRGLLTARSSATQCLSNSVQHTHCGAMIFRMPEQCRSHRRGPFVCRGYRNAHKLRAAVGMKIEQIVSSNSGNGSTER